MGCHCRCRFNYEINPNLHAERRLPRGRSLLIIGVLSALSWLVLIALFMALRTLI